MPSTKTLKQLRLDILKLRMQIFERKMKIIDNDTDFAYIEIYGHENVFNNDHLINYYYSKIDRKCREIMRRFCGNIFE